MGGGLLGQTGSPLTDEKLFQQLDCFLMSCEKNDRCLWREEGRSKSWKHPHYHAETVSALLLLPAEVRNEVLLTFAKSRCHHPSRQRDKIDQRALLQIYVLHYWNLIKLTMKTVKLWFSSDPTSSLAGLLSQVKSFRFCIWSMLTENFNFVLGKKYQRAFISNTIIVCDLVHWSLYTVTQSVSYAVYTPLYTLHWHMP